MPYKFTIRTIKLAVYNLIHRQKVSLRVSLPAEIEVHFANGNVAEFELYHVENKYKVVSEHSNDEDRLKIMRIDPDDGEFVVAVNHKISHVVATTATQVNKAYPEYYTSG